MNHNVARIVKEFISNPNLARESVHRLVKRLNVTEEEIKIARTEFRVIKLRDTEEEFTEKHETPLEFKHGVSKDGITNVEVTLDSEIIDAPQLLRLIKMNPDEFEVISFYRGYRRGKWWATIQGRPKAKSNFSNFFETYKSNYVPLKKSDIILNDNFGRKSLALISLCDFHLDKLVVGDNDLDKRIKLYLETLKGLLYQCYRGYLIDEIVFVLGNDFFHTDTVGGTTTKGTPVDIATTWDKAYELGFDLMVESINHLKQFCNKLNIILVQGNHDQAKSYFLAHALEVYFALDENIVFDRTSNKLKTFSYGDTLLCFQHGEMINDKLPLAFASTFYEEWGKHRFKEILLADKHHNSEIKIGRSQGEAQGVRMRILPTITKEDQWHLDNLFTNAILAGIAIVYDKEKGRVAEYEHRI